MACFGSGVPPQRAVAPFRPGAWLARWRDLPQHPSFRYLFPLLLPALLTLGSPALSGTSYQTEAIAEGRANKGLKLAQAGDLKAAEAELRKAVAESPDDPDYLADLGGVLGMERKLEEANTYFERALKINPSNLVIRRDLAANLWQLDRLSEAAENLERILKVNPGDRASILLLGMVAENQKNYAKAVTLLASVPNLVQQRPESIAALARSYYQTGQAQRARETLDLLSRPAEPQGALLGSEVASGAGDYETALKLLETIKATYPDRAGLEYQIALAQYGGNRFRDAENTLLGLITTGYQTSDVYNLLVRSYYKQGIFDQAIRAFDLAIDRAPTKESNYLDLGKALLEHHRDSVAIAVAQKGVERIPTSYRLYMMKGLIETKRSNYKEAVASYARAFELNPVSPEANFDLARLQDLAGMPEEAKATFERGIQRFPKYALTYQGYALMLLRIAEEGDPASDTRAVSLLQTAIRLDPTLPESHYQLGNLWLKEGKTLEALRELEVAAKFDPREAKIHYALFHAYRRLGRNQQAANEVKLFQKLNAEQGVPLHKDQP